MSFLILSSTRSRKWKKQLWKCAAHGKNQAHYRYFAATHAPGQSALGQAGREKFDDAGSCGLRRSVRCRPLVAKYPRRPDLSARNPGPGQCMGRPSSSTARKPNHNAAVVYNCARVPVILLRRKAQEKIKLESGRRIIANRSNARTEGQSWPKLAPDNRAWRIPSSE